VFVHPNDDVNTCFARTTMDNSELGVCARNVRFAFCNSYFAISSTSYLAQHAETRKSVARRASQGALRTNVTITHLARNTPTPHVRAFRGKPYRHLDRRGDGTFIWTGFDSKSRGTR
jgi:hypothetical protein